MKTLSRVELIKISSNRQLILEMMILLGCKWGFSCVGRRPSMWFHHVRQSPDSEGRTVAVNYCMFAEPLSTMVVYIVDLISFFT